MWSGLLKDILPLVGVIVGAGLQYLFSRSAENTKHLRSMRTEAYIDYLRSVGEMEQFISFDPNDPKRKEAFARAISAKARVCVCGSPDVVDALAKFEGVGGLGMTPEKRRFFLDFIEKMRSDVGAIVGQSGRESIESILLGSDVPHNKQINRPQS